MNTPDFDQQGSPAQTSLSWLDYTPRVRSWTYMLL